MGRNRVTIGNALVFVAIVVQLAAADFRVDGDDRRAQQRSSPSQAIGESEIAVGMPLDEALELLRKGDVACKCYPTSEVAGKLGIDMTKYVVESRRSGNAFLVFAVKKDRRSPMRIQELIWYRDWRSLSKLRGIDLVNARGELLTVRRAKVAVARLKQFQDSGYGSPKDAEFRAPRGQERR